MKKKSNPQKVCDTLMQKVGTKRYSRCEICSQPVNCMHHFFPKSVSAMLRYDWSNLIPICQGCHARHHQAGDPRIHGTVIQKRGLKWYEELLKKKQILIKVNAEYYRTIKARLEQELHDI